MLKHVSHLRCDAVLRQGRHAVVDPPLVRTVGDVPVQDATSADGLKKRPDELNFTSDREKTVLPGSHVLERSGLEARCPEE